MFRFDSIQFVYFYLQPLVHHWQNGKWPKMSKDCYCIKTHQIEIFDCSQLSRLSQREMIVLFSFYTLIVPSFQSVLASDWVFAVRFSHSACSGEQFGLMEFLDNSTPFILVNWEQFICTDYLQTNTIYTHYLVLMALNDFKLFWLNVSRLFIFDR